MVIDIKMCRFENVPWGFRLVGGADFEYPLTVVKVTEGSIAEESGLCIGDVIVRINETATSPLTHDAADQIIRHCGNVFYFGVYREMIEEERPKIFPVSQTEYAVGTPQSFLTASRSSVTSKSPHCSIEGDGDGEDEEYLPELPERPCSVLSENTEIKLVEEEIAAVLSGESEVLKEHNVMGVNFYRIFPKPGVCMTSDVLRTLNEEAIKTKAEKDKENKKWTTFLQKPNRPIPKSQAQIEAERRAANAYKVQIIKSKPEPELVKPVVEPEPEPPVESPPKEATPEPQVEEPPPADSEVPNLEENNGSVDNQDVQSVESSGEEKTDKEKDAGPEQKELVETNNEPARAENGNVDDDDDDDELKQRIPTPVPTDLEREKTEEELALERQLNDVQKQLAALSNLPTTIQATLDAVTKQLADLLPTFKLQQQQAQVAPHAVEPREISLTKIDESPEEAREEAKTERDAEEQRKESLDNADKDTSTEQDIELQDVEKRQHLVDAPIEPRHPEMLQMEEEQNQKKQKYDVIEELEEHLERKNKPTGKRSKRAFGPLTPSSERPLVLPGGRRWYRPKDAYNDEFIAETLSAQAEIISGTTLGVNFMKYQKPERKIDLNRSEVYKVIHHLDRQPVRGIEVRPPVVAAEVDIKKALLQS